MNCNFSLEHYKYCLEKIRDSNFQNIMLHDVDIWTDNMSYIFDMESEMNINSIWFFRFHAKNYNLMSYDKIKFLQKFENEPNILCGLHIEGFYLKYFSILKEQLSILEKIINKQILHVSIHEPQRFLVDHNELKSQLNELNIISYKSIQERGKKYISDSSCNWREGCMCNHIGKQDLFILTHTNWWYNEYSGEIY
jgi:uncharacterized membrane protein